MEILSIIIFIVAVFCVGYALCLYLETGKKIRRRTPYIEIGNDILDRIRSMDSNDHQMIDLVETILVIVLVKANQVNEIYYELLYCGFKVPVTLLNKVIDLMDEMEYLEKTK